MEVCSFLSTCDERVDCFKGCPFYCHEEYYSECPFKSVTGKSKQNVRKLYQYYYSENYEFDFDEEIEARLID